MSAAAGFRRLAERELWKGHVLELLHGTFEAPDGAQFEREYVRLRRAVAVVPVDGDHAVLVAQYRAPLDRVVLEIPAGLCDVDGEDVEATANRELVEEAGLHAARLERLCAFENMAGSAQHETVIFLGTELERRDVDRHGPEETHMTIERVPLAAVLEMVARGDLFDAKTVIGLLLARERLGFAGR